MNSPSLDHQARLTAGRACLVAALTVYLPHGFSITCCCDPDHVGVGKKHGRECDSPGKCPMHPWKGLQTRLPTVEEVERRWADYPIGNVGAVLGQVSGIVRVDSDSRVGETTLQQWSQGDLPPTWEFCSSPDSRGLLYAWPRDLPCKTTARQKGAKHEELRLMGNGSQTVLPPSRHPTGGYYTWVIGHSPTDLPLAPAPAWLLTRLHVPASERTTSPSAGPRTADYDRVMQALALIPNDDAPYDNWLMIGMALHHTGAPWAREAWDRWSEGSTKFDADKQDKSWGSFGASTKVVTLGSLFYRVYSQQRQAVPDMTQAPWHTTAQAWTGSLATINATEVPSWH